MNNRFSNALTVLLCALLVIGAVCIGGVKGYQEEREELLLGCMEMHARVGDNLQETVADCEEAAADFDARLKHRMMGRLAGTFGVEPVSESVRALHSQLLREQADVAQTPDLLEQLGSQVGELLEDNIDSKLSLSKVFWTAVCLYTLFGKKARRKGFTFGKLLAGFGLFNMWKKK